MVREYNEIDLCYVNKLLEEFDYNLDDNSFNNEFLNIVLYEDKNYIKGVLVYQFFYDRLEIDYIIVDSLYRNCGIASKLLNYIEKKHSESKNITLEVRESNLVAINFYKKNGFNIVTKRRNYYKDEDGILMLKKLGE